MDSQYKQKRRLEHDSTRTGIAIGASVSSIVNSDRLKLQLSNFTVFSDDRSSNANEKLVSSESAENIETNENGATSSSPRIRNRYLKRIGVGDDMDDELPLLNDN